MGVVGVVWLAVQTSLVAEPARQAFDLPADVAARSLKLFARQSGVQVLISASLGRETRTQPVKGWFTPREALDRMLAETGLTVKEDEKNGTMAVLPPNASGESSAAPNFEKTKESNRSTPGNLHSNGSQRITFPAAAQSQVENGAGSAVPRPDEVIALSPFVVNSEKDLGYLAANTISGSRLNTRLFDTSASISEMTKEFLDDIGANDTMAAVDYALGFQTDQPGANDNLSQFQGQTVVARGVGRNGTVSRDFFPWNLSSDTFSTERLSLSRGPNSILYGVGNAGGIINTMSKRANFGNRTVVSVKTDENGSQRYHVDQNRRLGNSLAVRVNLLLDNKKTWRELEYTNSKRLHLASTWRPFSRTEVRFDFERGVQDRLVGLRFSGRDQFTQWIDAGSLAYDRLVDGNNYPAGTASYGANPVLSYDGDANQWFNYQRLAQTRGEDGSTGNGNKLRDETYLPFTAMLSGPAATTDNSYWTGSMFLQQRLAKNLFIEFAINKQSSERAILRTVDHSQVGIKIDANRTLPNGASNPHFGEMFIEGQAFRNEMNGESLSERIALTYEWDSRSKWRGSHRLLALATREDSDNLGQQFNEVNLTPLRSTVPALSNAQNRIFRRTYLNFSGGNRSYNQNPFQAAQPPVAFVDPVNALAGTITPGFFRSSFNPTNSRNDSAMIAGQSRFWNDRVFVTYGFRRDRAARQNSTAVRDATTQEVIGADWNPTAEYTGNTRTQGLVFHATDWLSIYGNRSNNFTPQSGLDINGDSIGNVRGDGKDYGVKFRFGDNKIYARAGYYQTSVLDQIGREFDVLVQIQQIWTALEGGTGQHVTKFFGSPLLNTDTQDFDVDGYEFEIVANPIKGLALTMNYATLKGVAANLFPITRAHIAENRAQWAANGSVSTTGGTVADALAQIDSLMGQVALQDGREGTGNYSGTFNAFGRYQFQSNVLKGWSLGTGFRYRDGRVLGYDAALKPVRAPKFFQIDASLTYQRPIWNRRVDMRLQLNVRNLLNNRDLIWARIDPTTFRKEDYTLYTPREITLTGSFSF